MINLLDACHILNICRYNGLLLHHQTIEYTFLETVPYHISIAYQFLLIGE